MMFDTGFRLLAPTLLVAGMVMSSGAFAATDGFGNDNFKGNYFDDQAPAALADDNGATLNGITPAAGAALTKTDTAQTGEATTPQNPENGNPSANPAQENEHPAMDMNPPSGVSGHSP